MQVSIHQDLVHIGNSKMYGKDFEVFDWKELLPEIVAKHVWSGIIWSNGKRAKKNFLSSSWCVLDFDDPLHSLDETIRTFCDVQHIIGTSKSHRVKSEKNPTGGDRFRLAMPFDREITWMEEYEFNMKCWIHKLGCDPQCADAARYFWPCKEIVSVNLDPEAYTAEVEEYSPPRERVHIPSRAQKMGHLSPFALRVIKTGAIAGERNKTALKVYRELRLKGMDEQTAEEMAFGKIDLPADELSSVKRSVNKFIEKIGCPDPTAR